MKNAVTLKHLFKVVGRKGQALGSEEACIYFDGRHAVGANGEATVSIDCPLQISKPTLIPVSELKTALIANPELHFQPESDGGLRINGIRVCQHSPEAMPDETREILDLDKQQWRVAVRPFRMDGSRYAQVLTAMGVKDVRFYLNGLYLDFATGAIVGLDGKRLHLVEDVLPTAALAPERKQGVILPGAMARMLADLGGVQEVFVMEREAPGPKGTLWQRVICVGAANAKFRIREIASDTFPNYRDAFDRNKTLPINVVLDAASIQHLLAVAGIAQTNPNRPYVTIEGEARQIRVRHQERVVRELPARYQEGGAFVVHANGAYLTDAIRAAQRFGSTVRMRFQHGDEPRGIYVGAQDFHSIVMARKEPEDDEAESSQSATDAESATTAALAS